MTKYNIYQNGVFVGYTTNHQEMTQYLAAHPGATQNSVALPEGTPPGSTLPKLQEEPATPKGDLLQQ